MKESAIFFVYILQNKSTGRFYIGSTNHLIRRFNEHQSGYSPATRNKGPWWMPYYEEYPDRAEAAKRERELKSKKSAKSIRRIISRSFPELEITF